MAIYNYNLITDFTNGINPTCLDRTITEYGFPSIFQAVNIEYENDHVHVVFESDLSTADKTDLDILISNHNPLSTCDFEKNAGSNLSTIVLSFPSGTKPHLKLGSKNIYNIAATFIFKGTNHIDSPTKFKIIARINDFDKPVEKYCYVKLFDYTNSINLCEIYITGGSGTKEIWMTEEISNLSVEESIIEVQWRSNTDLFLESLTF